MNIQEKQQFTI